MKLSLYRTAIGTFSHIVLYVIIISIHDTMINHNTFYYEFISGSTGK